VNGRSSESGLSSRYLAPARRVEREREALNQTIGGLRGELDAEHSEREKGDKRVRSTLRDFARNGLWTSLIGVVVLLVAALATGLPAGTEHLLCG